MRVQPGLARLANQHLDAKRTADHLIRRRLVDTAIGVDTGIDARDVAARRHDHVGFGDRIKDLDPWIADRAIAAVARAALNGALVQVGRLATVQDGEAILQVLVFAMIEDGGLERVADGARDGDEGDLVDRLERLQGGAQRRVNIARTINLELARTLLDEALRVAETTGHPLLCVGVRIAFSRWHRLSGDGPAARAWADDALVIARHLESAYLEGQALIARGQAAWLLGNLSQAEADLRGAFSRLDALGAAYDAAHAALLHSALRQAQQDSIADTAWLDVARRILEGGYGGLLGRERAYILPWLASRLHHQEPAIHVAVTALVQHVLRVPAPPLHVVGLGQFAVSQGQRMIPAHAWEPRKAGELFRFLLVQPHFSAYRDITIEALWPDRLRTAGERLLQQATSVLRHVLDPDLPDKFPSRYLTVADHHLALRLPPDSTLDFCQFEQALTHAFTAPLETLARVLERYTGDLFLADRYAEWARGPRERLAKLYERGLLHLAECALEARDLAQALVACDRLLERDPWNEDAVQVAMHVCLACNDRPGALRRYEALRHTLRRDLHLAPRADLRTLAETLHNS